MFFSLRRDSWRMWLALGLGLSGYGYYEWSSLSTPTSEQLEQMVEAQYRFEIDRLQQQAGEQPIELSREWQQKYRTAIRSELMAPGARARKRAQSILTAGMLMLVVAAGMFVHQRLAPPLPGPGTR